GPFPPARSRRGHGGRPAGVLTRLVPVPEREPGTGRRGAGMRSCGRRAGRAVGRERSMAVQKIIIDCDPGIGDALALLFAHGHPDLELCGITTVAGNVGLDLTTANALRVREYAGLGEVPVVAGCARPLLRSVIDARDVHGESGLGAVTLP